MDQTEIRLGKVIDDSMIISPAHNVRFEKLTLSADRRSADRPLIKLFSAKDIRFDSVRLDTWGAPALDAQDVSGLVVRASELIENGSFYGSSRQVFMSGNRFRVTGYGESVVVLWGGRDFGTVFDANRFTGLRYGFVDGYKLMWTHDGKFKAGPPASSKRMNTILHNNRFDRGSAKVDGSSGFLTMHPGNTWMNVGSTWTNFSRGNQGIGAGPLR